MSPALAFALKLLQHADRFSTELRRRLEEKGFEESEIEDALAQLAAKRLLNDDRTAQVLIESATRRGKGKTAIREDFLKRGVKEDQIDQWIEQCAGDEAETAEAFLQTKFPMPTAKDSQRAAGQLLRRGHDPDLVEEAIRRHFALE